MSAGQSALAARTLTSFQPLRHLMRRDLIRLARETYDLLILGGGIHGVAAACDASQRGLSVALVERGDFGSAASFNHLKTVHGGLRYLQTGDLKRMRESIVERRVLARIAPHLLTPLPFLMPTYRKLTRSQLAMRVAFAVDALVGRDRNDGVVPRLRIPAGRVLPKAECLRLFPDVRRQGLTGGALWYDYQMRNTDRLTLAFALAADANGACLANYAEARSALLDGGRVTGARVRDRLTGDEFDVRARVTLNVAGAGAGRIMEAFGSRIPHPLLKAMNLVTRRSMSGPALASSTNSGRMLFVVPWQGRLLAGTSHSQAMCGPDDADVSADELQSFVDEVNEAFPALRLTADDVTMVHRGVVPAVRKKGEVGLEGHFRIRDHAAEGIDGVVSLVGVKYTTGRGVATEAVDAVMRKLGRQVPGRSATTPLPGAAEDPDAVAAECARRVPGVAPAALQELALTYGTQAAAVLDLAQADPALARPLYPGAAVLEAQVVYAVREEMACALVDVVTRRTPLGSVGHPGAEAAAACACVMARECGWDAARVAAELAALDAFYLPIR